MSAMSRKSLRLFYSVLLLLGISFVVVHIVRIWIGAERFSYITFGGLASICGLCCYRLYFGRARAIPLDIARQSVLRKQVWNARI